MSENYTGALSWDSTISQESSFVLLEPGEYDFRVKKATRTVYTPSDRSKIREQSPMLELELSVFNDKGQEATVFENLILHTVMEWKISEFFISIGQKKPGEPFQPDWDVEGATGRADIEINRYTNKDGQERENNRVNNFLEPNTAQPTPAQTYQQPAQPPAQPQATQPQQPVQTPPTQTPQTPPVQTPPVQQQPVQQNEQTNQPQNPGFNF